MNQSNSLDFKLVQRVCLLQQALDQALDSLEEMRDQVQDKQWVEAQLASTEKYANVQQQAIAQLKHHLSQFTEVQHHLLGVMGYRLNELMDHQQVEFDRLKIQIQKGETELQTYLQYLQSHCNLGVAPTSSEVGSLNLEAEVMIARAMAVSLSCQLSLAKQHLTNVTSALNDHHLNLGQIIQTTQAMITDLASLEATATPQPQQTSITNLETLDMPPEDVGALRGRLRRQDLRVHELETALVEQFGQQTQLKQRCQALAAERDFYKRQLEKLKNEPPQLATLTTEAEAVDTTVALTPYLLQPRLRSQPPPPIQPLKLNEELE